MTIFSISEFKNTDFLAKMDKFTRKAARLGLTFGYTLESTGESSYTLPNDERVYYAIYNYSVYGDSPTINGYTFLAKIEPLEPGVNLIHSYNSDRDFSEYRTAELTCEHCKVNRMRNFYYLIQNDDDKSVKMVGHNCLANYINLPNAESIAEFYSDFIVSGESTGEEEPGHEKFYRGLGMIKLIDFVALAKVIIKKIGYVSGKNETPGNTSTKTLTANEFFNVSTDRIKITDEDKKETESILESVKDDLSAKKNLTEYEFTILTLIETGSIKYSHAGYAVSIIPLYNRIKGTIKTETTDKKESLFIGTPGEKITNVNAVVTFYNQYDNNFNGYTHLYKFDNDGNVITYFSSKDLNLAVGDNVLIKLATVKKHDSYNGVNQTVITRGKIDVV